MCMYFLEGRTNQLKEERAARAGGGGVREERGFYFVAEYTFVQIESSIFLYTNKKSYFW